mgnify:CR=1 FL=1
MASFCTKCGKPLADGEVCSCSQNVAQEVNNVSVSGETQVNNTVDATQAAQINNMGYQTGMQNNMGYQQNNIGVPNNMQVNNMGYQAGMPNNMQVNNMGYQQNNAGMQAKNFFVTLWQLILNIFKKPYTAAGDYLKTNEVLTSIILIVVQGIFTGILASVAVGQFIRQVIGTISKAVDYNPFGTFFMAMLISVALTFLYALIIFAISAIFKMGVNYVQAMKIMAIRSVIVIAGTLIAIIVACINAIAGVVFGVVVVQCIAFVYSSTAIKASTTALDDNKYLYALVIYIAAALLVYYIFAIKIGLPNLPLLKLLSNGLGGLSSLIGGLDSLGSLMN